MLIAAATKLSALRDCAGADGHELLAFTDADTLLALDAITTRRPSVITLEENFANSPRGTALVKRIKADPTLVRADVRVVAGPERDAAPRPVSAVLRVPQDLPLEAPPLALVLDPHGTRRVPRVSISGAPEVMVDGNPATLVDLSVIGAQVLSPTVLKPNQPVRVALSDDQATVRVNGTIVWASFQIPPQSAPRYRAGIEFAGGDTHAIEGYCQRHGES